MRLLNGSCDILRTTRAAVDLPRILGMDTLSPASLASRAVPLRAAPAAAFAPGAAALLAGHAARVGTCCLVAGAVEEGAFVRWLEALLWEPSSLGLPAAPTVLRGKGVLCAAGGGQSVLQVVRQLYELGPSGAPLLLEDPPLTSRLLLIGRDLNGGALAASLTAAGAGQFRIS